jgi:hypothetical protein
MSANLPSGILVLAVIFSIISIIICIAQIVLRKKVKLLSACKVSIFFPLMFIIVKATSETSQAFDTISKANDLSPSIIHKGISVILASISLGLSITIFLSILYVITKSIYENQ